MDCALFLQFLYIFSSFQFVSFCSSPNIESCFISNRICGLIRTSQAYTVEICFHGRCWQSSGRRWTWWLFDVSSGISEQCRSSCIWWAIFSCRSCAEMRNASDLQLCRSSWLWLFWLVVRMASSKVLIYRNTRMLSPCWSQSLSDAKFAWDLVHTHASWDSWPASSAISSFPLWTWLFCLCTMRVHQKDLSILGFCASFWIEISRDAYYPRDHTTAWGHSRPLLIHVSYSRIGRLEGCSHTPPYVRRSASWLTRRGGHRLRSRDSSIELNFSKI